MLPCEVGDGLIGLAEEQEGCAQVELRLSVGGIELGGAFEVGNGFRKVAALDEEDSQCIVQEGGVWSGSEGLRELRLGFCGIAGGGEGGGVGEGLFRREGRRVWGREGLMEEWEGGWIVGLGGEGSGEVEGGGEVVGVEGVGAGQGAGGGWKVALGEEDGA